ncbi:MAG: hypothetical protein MUC34_01030 [Anaerolineae bacterium]|nr:hypothetical protein [Anaerolineae bacterium]
MAGTRVPLSGKALTTPRAAAFAGIIFALLYGTSLVLVRLAVPEELAADGAWLAANSRRISVALNLVPYSGIAFLWFIGVLRDRLGELEDRFFATVFLGSGLLFLGMIFVGAALAGGMLLSYEMRPDVMLASPTYTYGRAVMYLVLNTYAVRMSAVFMISLGTIWLRTGSMHRGWVYVTYALALALLVVTGRTLWVGLIFPIWVLGVSILILVFVFRRKSERPTPNPAG